MLLVGELVVALLAAAALAAVEAAAVALEEGSHACSILNTRKVVLASHT